jgi:hypothetical protein
LQASLPRQSPRDTVPALIANLTRQCKPKVTLTGGGAPDTMASCEAHLIRLVYQPIKQRERQA